MYDQNEQFQVQKIVKFRLAKRLTGHQSYDHIELQIKWVGFPHSQNTWEPLTEELNRNLGSMAPKFFRALGYELKCIQIDNAVEFTTGSKVRFKLNLLDNCVNVNQNINLMEAKQAAEDQ